MRQVFRFPLTLRACVGFLLAVVPIGDAWLRAMRAGVAMRNSYSPAAGLLNLWNVDHFHPSE